MDGEEALKNLIPMSDDEQDELVQNDIQITSRSIAETPIYLRSPTKSIYGDFSMNSFVIVDTADAVKEDSTNVYMESVVDLVRTLNTKMDALFTEKTREKATIEKVRSLLSVNNTKGALSVLGEPMREDPGLMYLYEALVSRDIPEFVIGVRQELVGVSEDLFLLKNCYREVEAKFIKRVEENERLKGLISQQSKDHKAQVESLVSENNNTKDQLVTICKEYGAKDTLESLLEEDVLREIKTLVSTQSKQIAELREEVTRKDEIIGQFERRASTFEISHLTSHVESLKETQRKLQDENLNLTQIVNKLSEKNTKLKQELIFFNNELKKSVEALGRKNETIARQKSLIELFQEKIGGTATFPIEDLRRKKQELEERMEKENDYFVKQRLRKEREDCTKRLSDFLDLQVNRKV